MKCNHCNYENAEGSSFCNKCGKSLGTEPIQHTEGEKEGKKEGSKAKPKKIMLASGIGLGAIILAGILVFMARGSYAKQVISSINKGDLTKAQTIFVEKIKDNTAYEAELKELVIDESKKIISTYADGKLTYEDAKKKLESIYQFNNVDPSQKQESFTYISKLKDSRDQFDKGNELIESEPRQAMTCFEKVIEEDTNYNKAQELLQQATKNYETQTINSVIKLGEENNYAEALGQIKRASETLKDNAELTELYSKYQESLNQQVLAEADQLIQDKQYDAAKELLTKNQNYDLNTAMYNKLEEIKTLKENEVKDRIKEIKPRISVVYDEIDKDYIIVPKGYKTKYNNLSRTTNIELRIIMDTDPTLMMLTGFIAEDWLFIKKLTFACDDKRQEIALEYFDRGSQIIGGGDIAEWYAFAHNDLGIETSQLKNLEPLIKDIIDSQKASIRFSGDSYIDHTITSNERQAIKDLWEVYTILDEFPSAIDLIK